MVQIRPVPHFQIILWFIIMFTLFGFQNDFHPWSNVESGSVASRLKRLFSKRGDPWFKSGQCLIFKSYFVWNYAYQVDL